MISVLKVFSFSLFAIVGLSTGTHAGGAPDVEAGAHIANTFCAKCHAVGMTGKSPFETAPPFRTFQQKWPLEDLEEALAEGIVVGHEAMPAFELSENQIANLIGYLHTLDK